jgi:hypothetical protein
VYVWQLGNPIEGSAPFPKLGHIDALCTPHGRRGQPHDNCCRHQRVEGRVELCRDVGGVAEHACDNCPLGSQQIDGDGDEEDGGEDQGGVRRGQGRGAKAGFLKTR